MFGQWTLKRWRAGADAHPVETYEGAPVRCHREVPGPMVTGLLRLIILLPHAAKDWDASRMTAVLAHEMAHLQRQRSLVA